MRITPIFFLLGAAFLFDCASLTPYPAGTCGNRVVDVGEDCDEPSETNPQCNKECRLACSDTLACPAGWGCGTDDICRQMTGRLQTAKAPVSANVVTLQAGDFDADGHVDIIGSPPFGSGGGSRVHYFDDKGELATTTALDVSISIPIVKNLDGEPGDDIGFAVRNLLSGAFGALSGQSDRTFSTIVFPSSTFPQTDGKFAVLNAGAGLRLPGGLSSCAVGIVEGTQGRGIRSLCNASSALQQAPLAVPLDVSPADVKGLPRTGRIDANASACGQVVFTTASSLYIVSPCTPGLAAEVDWQSAIPPLVVPLPGTLAEEIYVGPVEDFGLDRIVVRIDDKGADSFLVFNPETKGFDKESKFSRSTGLPLATGNLDGDEYPDFVFSTEIKLSTPDPLVTVDAGGAKPPKDAAGYRGVKARDQLRWTAARIGRFNDDDLPDVLVSFTSSLDVDVMGNAGGGRFTPFTVRSEQTVRAITSGDFDGDRIEDVAFFQSAGELGTDSEATLTLAFGSAVGGPEAPRTAGKFKYGSAISALRGANGADDLAVVQITPAAGTLPTTSIAVLLGNGGRQQVSPLFMNDPVAGSDRVWQPASFSVGAFTAKDTNAIIAMATGFRLRAGDKGSGLVPYDFLTAAWAAAPNKSALGGLDPFVKVADLNSIVGFDQDAFKLGTRQLRLISAVGDIDVPKDGIDELVDIAPLAGENAVGVLVVHTQESKESSSAPVAKIADARVEEGDPVELVDLDRDGFLDLVYIIRIANKRTLSVLRGDGKGSFLPTPITSAGTSLADDAVAFAKLDTGLVTKLAVVTKSQLWLVDLGKDGALHPTDATSALGLNPGGVPDLVITDIVGGDINGDGVPDLAVAQGRAVRVILQEPTNP